MKGEGFERLKAVCEKEGFEINCKHPYSVLVFVKKKDIWEGVEFCECLEDYNGYAFKGKIYKVKSIDSIQSASLYEAGYSDGIWVDLEYFKPSTESAYVDQLKKEALKRFPNIKEGDILKTDWTIDNVKISKGVSGFCYIKYGDMLLYNTTAIYKEGKWAERVKERVKVTHELKNHFCDSLIIKFSTGYVGNPNEIAKFLASQLEKYLNGEIE